MRNLTLILCSIMIGLCIAQMPEQIHFQALLTDDEGDLLNDDIDIEFKIYDSETDGTLLWTESQTVTAIDGVISTFLGSLTPFADDVDFNDHLWLGVSVDGGDEIEPRYMMGASPHTIRAKIATHAETAEFAANADHAATADDADEAVHAVSADSSDVSSYAHTSGIAEEVSWSGITEMPAGFSDGIDNIGESFELNTSDEFDGDGTEASPLALADGMINIDKINATDASDGQIIKMVDGSLAWAADVGGGTGDDWGEQVVEHTLVLDGDGTDASPLDIAIGGIDATRIADGAIDGAHISDGVITLAHIDNSDASDDFVIKQIDGELVWAEDAVGEPGTGDDWGDQTVEATDVFTGNGTAFNPLDIADGGIDLSHIDISGAEEGDVITYGFGRIDWGSNSDDDWRVFDDYMTMIPDNHLGIGGVPYDNEKVMILDDDFRKSLAIYNNHEGINSTGIYLDMESSYSGQQGISANIILDTEDDAEAQGLDFWVDANDSDGDAADATGVNLYVTADDRAQAVVANVTADEGFSKGFYASVNGGIEAYGVDVISTGADANYGVMANAVGGEFATGIDVDASDADNVTGINLTAEDGDEVVGIDVFADNGDEVIGVESHATNGLSETYGTFTMASSSTGDLYGLYSLVGIEGDTDKYGIYSHVPSQLNSYAIFGHVDGDEGYAGYFEGGMNYFEGNVGIGDADEPTNPLTVTADVMDDYRTDRYVAKIVNTSEDTLSGGVHVETNGIGINSRAKKIAIQAVTRDEGDGAGKIWAVTAGAYATDAVEATGILGQANYADKNKGVSGYALDEAIYNFGVTGYAAEADTNYGIYGYSNRGDVNHGGKLSASGGDEAYGLYVDSYNGSKNYGIYTEANSFHENYGIYSKVSDHDESYAGYFLGGRNYFEGNVGIGDDDPDNLLSVIGEAGAVDGGPDAAVVYFENNDAVNDESHITLYVENDPAVTLAEPEERIGIYSHTTGDGSFVSSGYGIVGSCYYTNNGTGVRGLAKNNTNGRGISGIANSNDNNNYGVYGYASGEDSRAIYGNGTSADYAGYFMGNVKVTGHITAKQVPIAVGVVDDDADLLNGTYNIATVDRSADFYRIQITGVSLTSAGYAVEVTPTGEGLNPLVPAYEMVSGRLWIKFFDLDGDETDTRFSFTIYKVSD